MAIILTAIISLMIGGAFGYILSALMIVSSKDNETPEQENAPILGKTSLKHNCVKSDFPKDIVIDESQAPEIAANLMKQDIQQIIKRNLLIERNPYKMRYEATVNFWTEN